MTALVGSIYQCNHMNVFASLSTTEGITPEK